MVGGVHSKFNQIPSYQDGWATNWRIILLKKFFHRGTLCQAPQHGDLAWRGRASREFGFEDQWGLIAGASQDSGKQPSLLENAHKSHVHQYQKKKKMTSQSPGKAYLKILEGLLGMQWRTAVAHSGNKGTGSRGMESIYWHEISWRPKFWQQNLAPFNRLQALVLGHLSSNSQQGGNTATPISR